MARFKLTHSEDACCIDIRGDVRNPEPSTAVIRFPGGHVEVSRHSDGSYWVHVARVTEFQNLDEDVLGEIVDGRIDLTHEEAGARGVMPFPDARHIQHMALRIARASAPPPRTTNPKVVAVTGDLFA